jgi:hypothetical protein
LRRRSARNARTALSAASSTAIATPTGGQPPASGSRSR